MSVPAIMLNNTVKSFTCFAGRIFDVGIFGQAGIWVTQDCRSNLYEDGLQTTTKVL